MKIVADAHIPFVEDYFGVYGELVLKPGRAIQAADVKDADMLLVRSITQVDRRLLAKSRVSFVGSVTAGADHLETDWLDEAGIAWSVAAGFNAPPVADYVVSVVAALQRKGMLLKKRPKAAVVGVGNVGRLVVERLRWLGFDVLLCDPVRADQEPVFSSCPLPELADLDLISLHVPLTKSGAHPTYHIINEDFLKRQKLGCVLLNASRGAVVDSEALMRYGEHLHWCLDVFEHEPSISKLVLEQAFLATPHIAGYSVQSKIRGIDMIYRIACDKNIITPQTVIPVAMPAQTLAFAGDKHHWQDVVLGVFNPLVMTAMMRAKLLPAENVGPVFDEMRNQFNYRHEFAYTRLSGLVLSGDDAALIKKLGMRD